MGQGDGEVVTPLSCPGGWTRGRRLGPDLVSDIGGDGNSNGEDRFDFTNKSFLETATLSSHSGSLSQHRPRQTHDPDVGDHLHAHRAHAYAHANTSMHVQPCAQPQPQPQRPATAYDHRTGKPQDLGDESFLLSRQTSAATMALTTSSATGTVDATNSAHQPPLSSLQSLWSQEPKVELYMPLEPQTDDEHRTNPHRSQGLLDSLDNELLLPDTHLFAASDDRPSSSRSHLRYWRRNRSPGPDASKYQRVSSDGSPPSPPLDSIRPSMLITREEFEALPPTIQRKVSQSPFLVHQMICLCALASFGLGRGRKSNAKKTKSSTQTRTQTCIQAISPLHVNTHRSLFPLPFSLRIISHNVAIDLSRVDGATPNESAPFNPEPLYIPSTHTHFTFLVPGMNLPGMTLHDWVEQGAASHHDSASLVSIMQLPGLVTAWT